MRPRIAASITLVATLAALGCTAPTGTTATTPAATPAGASTTPTAAPATPGAGTPSTPGTPVGTRTPSAPRKWPTLQGEAGGAITLNGKQIGRDDAESERVLLATMGVPDETHDQPTCRNMQVKNTVYRWGAVKIVVLREADKSNPYGSSYPAGAIAGWRVDPTLDPGGRPSPTMTGPLGTTLGTDLATLRERFTTADWGSVSLDQVEGRPTFTVFSGDTTGAAFRLDAHEKVSAMFAGYSSC